MSANDEYRPSSGGEDAEAVVKDDATIEDPIDEKIADSDEQLARDDAEAIDESNIIESKTRGAEPEGGYKEPGDEEGLEQ